MTDLEELERRKRELELRRDIARLERSEKLTDKASELASAASQAAARMSSGIDERRSKVASWSWLWVAPCTLLGAYLVLGGLVDGMPIVVVVGAVFLLPLLAKVMRRR